MRIIQGGPLSDDGTLDSMQNLEQYTDRINHVIANGRFKDNWNSLQQWRPPQWFNNAKFGLFVHWGIYSVPAFGSEWYARNMYIPGSPEYNHHIATYGPHKDFGYKDFIPMFTAPRFDPDDWADLFARAGARYVVPVAEHHDGFQMYRSGISRWNSFDIGPHRDVLGELGAAFSAKGITMGVSSHRIEHWFFMGNGRRFDSDIHEPLQRGDLYWPSMPDPSDMFDIRASPEPSQEFLEDWQARTVEIIDQYKPAILYFDWWIIQTAAEPYLKRIIAYYYNRAEQWGRTVTVCYKHDALMFGTGTPDIERGQLASAAPYHWQSDTAIARNSWCYTENNTFKPWQELVQNLVDIVAKNGNLLLNVGPKADGTIADEDRTVLESIGRWLAINGEAIYGSKPWRRFGEGPTTVAEGQFADSSAIAFTSHDIRYTISGDSLYAIAMRGAADGIYRFTLLNQGDAEHLTTFHGDIGTITQLGVENNNHASLPFTRDSTALTLQAPPSTSTAPVVFRIRMR